MNDLPVAATHGSPADYLQDYSRRLSGVLLGFDWGPAVHLAEDLREGWRSGRQLFLCGNGGSGSNALHMANDFQYPLSKAKGAGIRAHALTENSAVITCLANDEGYENIFAYQLAVLAQRGDLLLAFSGSGNSPNILKALEEAKRLGVKSYVVLGYSGGRAKALCDVPIHFPVHDMQIAEDVQTILCHAIMQWLHAQRDQFIAGRGA